MVSLHAMTRMAALAVALAALAFVPARAADDVAGFYKGKQVFMKIGSPTGGGYDVNGRVVARHVGKHIPGEPTVVVQNVPGGGSLRLANQMYNVGERDGSMFGLLSSGFATTPLLTPDAAHYDPRKFSFLGSPIQTTEVLLIWHTAQVKTLADLYKTEITVGASSPGSATMDYPILLNAIEGTKFKTIVGYQGATEVGLALERGEVQGLVGMALNSMYTTRWAELWKKGEVQVMAQFGFKPNPRIPDIPLFPLPKAEADLQMVRILYARGEYGQPFVAPPDVPAARVAALRRAFDATMKDPEFLADAQKSKVDLDPVSGEELQKLTEDLMATPPAVVARLNELMNAGAKK
jgi:tripartite-type tricarboxylate transporter receptor subunit TctC